MSDSPGAGAACDFCGQRRPAATVEGEGGSVFCSAGCRDAYDALGGDAGEEERRERGAAIDFGQTVATDRDPDDGTVRTYFRVDGMYSETCEAFLESIASKRDGVASVEASYITETVRVDHDPDRISAEALREALTTLGYTAYLRTDARSEPDRSGGATRKSRELHGLRKRRDEQFMGLRYAAGILFGAFLLVPYVAILYPVHLAELLDAGMVDHFEGAFRMDGAGGFVFLRMYLVMTGVVVFFTGLPLLRGAYVSLRMRRPTTDLLVAIVALGAYLYSTLAALHGRLDVYYDLTIVVVASVTAATFYESSVKKRALNRLTDLTVSQVDTAQVAGGDGTTEVPVEDVGRDDEVVVREGERVPVGGTLLADECVVSEAVVTGESLPVEKVAGDEIVAGSIVTDGAAVVRPDERAASGLDRITTAIWDIQSADHGVRRRADGHASWLVPLVGGVAVAAGLGAFALGAAPAESLLTTLLAAFVVGPWALGLATPLSVATSLEDALNRGIVVFDETVFERLREVDVVVFDKTGTLTTGAMSVVDADGPPSAFDAAVALERRASHPVARAIVEAFESTDERERDRRPVPDGAGADDRGGVTTDAVESFETHGTGVEGVADGERVLVGTPELFADRGWTVDGELEARAERARRFGRIPTLVGRDGAAEGIAVVGDEPREGWSETVDRLAERGTDVVVLTGDHEGATRFLRDHDGVTRVFAGVTPDAKAEAVRRLAADRQVAMVGDGTNDAMALATADLGLSLGSGTALAADAADVTILDDDVASVEAAFDLARAARRRVRQNVALAFLYNLLLLPVALAGLLNPVVAMLAVVLTGGVLAANSTRALDST